MKIANSIRALRIAAALALAFNPGEYISAANAQAMQVPPAQVCFQATTGINGMVATLGAITGGAGGAAGIYTNVALTGGTGSGATANVTVAGGAVTAVAILNPGINYAVGDVLSAAGASIGGVSGFSVPVASIAINSSLSGGTVGMYVPGTLTPSQTWQDALQTTLNTNPIQLDLNGCATIYGAGTYRQIVYDSLGNQVWDQLTSVASVNPYWSGTATGTPNAITITDGGFSSTDGQAISFIASATNTGAATITVSGGSAIPIKKNGLSGPVTLTGGEIIAGNVASVVYSSAYAAFMLTSPVISSTISQFGQARLVATSSSTLVLQPYGGNQITINGANYSIPALGVTANIVNCVVNGVAGQALSPATLYYVYVFNNAGVLTLNFSTGGHTTDTTPGNVGVEILAGSSANTLVGMVFPLAGPALNYSGQNQLVASWFNRRPTTAQSALSIARTTTSTSLTEINTEIRCQYLVWGDDAVDVRLNTIVSNSAGVANVTSALAFDGVVLQFPVSQPELASPGQNVSGSISTVFFGPYASTYEGVHYVTLFGSVSSGTGTWQSPNTTTLQAIVKG